MMSDRQTVLDVVGSLPESATWADISDALLSLVARRGTPADVARLYRAGLTADALADYLNPAAEVSLEAAVADLEARGAARESA
jgi:hypothetical protein